MPTARPFAYNTGSTLSGTIQYGNLAILTGTTFPSGVDWWNGPDEELGYVIATENTAGNQPNPIDVPAYLNFFRTSSFSDSEFLQLASYVTGENFANTVEAFNYLFANGYWTSFVAPVLRFISAGEWFSLYLQDGVGYSWGFNDYGQLGNDDQYNNKLTPVAVCGGLTFSQISAGGSHSLGITTSGIAYAWGGNIDYYSFGGGGGQLGDDTTTDRSTPVAVCGGLTFSQVSAGFNHSLGITTTGIAYAWGTNFDYYSYEGGGQLGDDTTTDRSTPVAVCGGLTFSQVSAGFNHSLGITTTGIAYAWGTNFDYFDYAGGGQLGDNTTTNRSTPVAVCGGLTFAQISAGRNYSLGITTTGIAYAWGVNLNGQIGDSTGTNRSTPVAVCGGLTFSQISAGDTHSLGITTTGIAYAWGSNFYGQLGDNSITSRLTPVAVCGGLTFSQISAGDTHSLGITTTGIAYAWGSNLYGQIGINLPIEVSTPSLVCGGLTFSRISTGQSNISLGITTTGIAYGWGLNNAGQLGDNTITERITPVAVCGGLTFSQISSGNLHSLGITTTGIAYAWGQGSTGQLGDNTTVLKLTPVAVCGGLTFSQVSAGAFHSLGITTTGIAYAWGNNGNGELGDNSITSRRTPVAVCGGLTFSQISAGNAFSLGITTTGIAYAWGYNGFGQLGDNSITSRRTPVAVCGGLTFSQISAGNAFSLGITTTGIAYAWGYNGFGQLGDNSITSRRTPVAVCGGLTFSQISAGNAFSLGITTTGIAYAWGNNSGGQLGTGANYFLTPTAVCNI